MATFNIGIDPGLKGGVAIIRLAWNAIHPMPIRGVNTGGVIDVNLLLDILPVPAAACAVYIENQRIVKGQGATSALTIGTNYGKILGALEAIGYPYREVPPATWKRRAGLWGKDKAASVELAVRLYPAMADQLAYKLKKELKLIEGQAEALLIQRFGEAQ